MNRAEIITYIKETYQIDPDYPFSKDYAKTAVFRHYGTRKWFALCMSVTADKLGLEGEAQVDVITMKSDPMLIDGVVLRAGFHRAYHMNKNQWLTIELGDKVSGEEIMNFIDMSFELTEKKKKK